MSHSIEWQHDGRRLLLPVLILPPTPSADLAGVEGIALLDTGSTTTGITPRIVEALDLSPKGKRPIGSIQGEGQAERYLFRVALKLPDIEPAFPFVFEDIEGFELRDGFQPDALIGMDILRQCEFGITRAGSCSLSFG